MERDATFKDIYHVHPVSDTEDHILKCDFMVAEGVHVVYCMCKCNPTFKEENSSLIVVHNSFDGREGVEEANEILNSTTPFGTSFE